MVLFFVIRKRQASFALRHPEEMQSDRRHMSVLRVCVEVSRLYGSNDLNACWHWSRHCEAIGV
jgi:hypothetical protein